MFTSLSSKKPIIKRTEVPGGLATDTPFFEIVAKKPRYKSLIIQTMKCAAFDMVL